MSTGHRVQMVNDIADFFASEPDRETAVLAIAMHIRRYWDPRMRRQIVAHLGTGGDGMSDLARAAIVQLAEMDRTAAG